MKILVFDNYDSFTYNLVHLAEKITGIHTDVFRNDEITLEDVKKYDKIILSPGPGVPADAGLLLPLLKEYSASKCILGVCLGHQAIGEACGASLINLSSVFHGIATPVKTTANKSILFEGLQEQFTAGRYHSWIVDAETLPAELEITATDQNNFIMAMQHKNFDLQSVQFHPESVLTPDGETIMRNWLLR